MHGAGNDFVLFKRDNVLGDGGLLVTPSLQQLARISQSLADRKHGIGCDQVLVVSNTPDPDTSDYEMIIYNSDGSQFQCQEESFRSIGVAKDLSLKQVLLVLYSAPK
eukprot:gene14375-16963_t